MMIVNKFKQTLYLWKGQLIQLKFSLEKNFPKWKKEIRKVDSIKDFGLGILSVMSYIV